MLIYNPLWQVISISIGGGAAFTTDGEALVATRLSEKGVVVVSLESPNLEQVQTPQIKKLTRVFSL